MTFFRVFGLVIITVALTYGTVFGADTGNVPIRTIVSGDTGIKLDEYLTRLAGFGFSGAIIVAKDGNVVLHKGYGQADREQGRPITPDTILPIGSITKQFTGAAILSLEMRGMLSVSDPITRYFDAVPPDKQEITFHQLLTHTSGLKDGPGGDFDLDATRERVLSNAFNSKLLWKPGSKHRYANTNYSLLGMIVEKASGMGYEEYIVEHLFRPAGMLRTGYLIPKYRADELAIGYQDGERWGAIIEKPMLSDGPCWNLRANGGIHATVADMYRWHLALEGDQILNQEAKQKYFHPHVDEGQGDSFYGYGWVTFRTPRNTKLIAHNGGNGIFAADFRRYIDENVVFFVATNVASDFSIDPLGNEIARVIFGERYALPPSVEPFDKSTAAKRSGRYALPSGGKIFVSVSEKGQGLMLQGEGQDAIGLVASGRNAVGPALTAASERTKSVLEAKDRGDFRPLHQAFSGGRSLAEVQEMESELRKELEQTKGSYKSFSILGSMRGPQAVFTFVKLEFERGAQHLRFRWEGQELVGIRTVPGAGVIQFQQVGKDEYAALCMDPPSVLRIRFNSNGALAVVGADGEVVAKRE